MEALLALLVSLPMSILMFPLSLMLLMVITIQESILCELAIPVEDLTLSIGTKLMLDPLTLERLLAAITAIEAVVEVTTTFLEGLMCALRASGILECISVPLEFKLKIRWPLIAEALLKIFNEAISSDPVLTHLIQLLLTLAVHLSHEHRHHALVD